MGLTSPAVAASLAAGISPTLHTRAQDLVGLDQTGGTPSPLFRLFLSLFRLFLSRLFLGLFVRGFFSPSFTTTKTSGCICKLPSLV